MADQKITQLDPLTTSDPSDVIAVVDIVGAETKKQTKENFLKEVQADIDDHIGDTSNPHEVDASDIKGLTFRNNITPTGTVNGSNRVFTLPETPIVGSVQVYADGARMKPTVDYNIVGTTITFVVDSEPYSSVLTDYRV